MLIDSHCHLPHKKYGKPVAEVIAEAKAYGVEKFIGIGTSISDNKHLLKVLEEFPEVYGTLAIYPHENKEKTVAELKNVLENQLTQSSKIVGIGETGIDLSENWPGVRNLEQQIELFEMHLDLAVEHSLPVVIHNRNGDEVILDILREYKENTPSLTGVFHCFSGDWEFAQKVLEIGFYLSFTNIVTYPKVESLLKVVKNVPMNRFLVETDAPYLPPQTYRGQTNYPKYVKIVAEKIAQVKQKPFDEIAQASYDNTCVLFSLT